MYNVSTILLNELKDINKLKKTLILKSIFFKKTVIIHDKDVFSIN